MGVFEFFPFGIDVTGVNVKLLELVAVVVLFLWQGLLDELLHRAGVTLDLLNHVKFQKRSVHLAVLERMDDGFLKSSMFVDKVNSISVA